MAPPTNNKPANRFIWDLQWNHAPRLSESETRSYYRLLQRSLWSNSSASTSGFVSKKLVRAVLIIWHVRGHVCDCKRPWRPTNWNRKKIYLDSEIIPNWIAIWFQLQQQPDGCLQLEQSHVYVSIHIPTFITATKIKTSAEKYRKHIFWQAAMQIPSTTSMKIVLIAYPISNLKENNQF
jgi:hypothetical protein